MITVPFDSFETVPSLGNSNGQVLAAFLEIIRLISTMPITDNWVFWFAITDGSFCRHEGLERFVSSLSSTHGSSVEFAISIDSVLFGNEIFGNLAHSLKRKSYFANFIINLKEAFSSLNIDFKVQLSDEEFSHLVFRDKALKGVSIVGDENLTWITDQGYDVQKVNSVAWAVTEGLLRTMYKTDHSANILNRASVDSSVWLKGISRVTKMPAYRDPKIVQSIGQWLKKFGTYSLDEWTTGKCYFPSSSTTATLIFYNPTSYLTFLYIFLGTCVYGLLIFVVSGGLHKK